MRNQNILLISPDAWGKYYLSKHHYAICLAKHNKVWFLNHVNADLSARRVRVLDTEIPNLKVVNYRSSMRGLRYYPNVLKQQIFRQQQQAIMAEIGAEMDLVWSFDPYRFTDWSTFGAKFNLFHPVDLYHSPIELQVAANAQVIFATSQKILDRYQSLSIPSYFINHGLAPDFVNSRPAKLSLDGRRKIKAGLAGNLLHKHLAREVLLGLCKEQQLVDFYFIGPKGEGQELDLESRTFLKKLAAQDNVHFVDTLPYIDLRAVLLQLDLLMICYNVDRYEEAPPNPHKLLEYLSVGKVVVSNYFDVYKQQRHLIQMSDSLSDYSETFAKTITKLEHHNAAETIKLRQEYAGEFSYDKQLRKIERIIADLKKPEMQNNIGSKT